jgi:CRP/FNR family transcriptional regulator, cyclic AMP receptor protein
MTNNLLNHYKLDEHPFTKLIHDTAIHEKFLLSAEVLILDKASEIYSMNQPATQVYFVLKGSVKLGAEQGAEKIMVKHIAYPGEIFGENIFTDKPIRQEFSKTLEASTIASIPRNVFLEILQSDIKLLNYTASVMAKRIKELEFRKMSIKNKTARQRIVEFIQNRINILGTKIGIKEILVNHGLSNIEVSCLTGISRQTVSRIMGELKAEGIIHFSPRKPSKVLIKDIHALRGVF